MKSYKIKVTEKHVDTIIVEAESEEQAKEFAVLYVNPAFDCVYDCEILSEIDYLKD